GSPRGSRRRARERAPAAVPGGPGKKRRPLRPTRATDPREAPDPRRPSPARSVGLRLPDDEDPMNLTRTTRHRRSVRTLTRRAPLTLLALLCLTAPPGDALAADPPVLWQEVPTNVFNDPL